MTSTLRLLALSLAASAALLTSAHAAQNNGGGPTSTPTWTIGTKPHVAIEEVTIKEKSSTTKSGSQSNARPIYCPRGFVYSPMDRQCIRRFKIEEISAKPEGSTE